MRRFHHFYTHFVSCKSKSTTNPLTLSQIENLQNRHMQNPIPIVGYNYGTKLKERLN